MKRSAKKKKKPDITAKNRKYLTISFLFILGVCLFTIAGERGLIDTYGLSKQRDGIVAYNKSLEAENVRLAKEIHLLKTDKRYIATIAKREFGMIGDDEVLYKFEK